MSTTLGHYYVFVETIHYSCFVEHSKSIRILHSVKGIWTWTEICSDSEVCLHDDAAISETMRNGREGKPEKGEGHNIFNLLLTDETGDRDRDLDLDLDLDLKTENKVFSIKYP